jgi:alpha-beta hydrolase superfamily lysophospholipase
MLRLAALLGAAIIASSAAAGPPKLRETCLKPAERAAAVSFAADDGTKLVGVLVGRGRRGVVLAHEKYADLCSWLPYGRTLVARGYRVFALDLRGFGSSARPPDKARYRYDRDIVAAAKLLRQRGVTRVVLIGGSIGGAAVVVGATAITPAVVGVVAVSAPAADADVNALAAVRKLRVPILLVNGGRDPLVPLSDARRLYRAAASREKRLVIIASGSHGSALLSGGDAAARRMRSVLDEFVDDRLRG